MSFATSHDRPTNRMSKLRALALLAAGLAFVCLLAGPAPADDRDLLERTRQLKEIAAQKVEQEVREARRVAYALRDKPEQAVERLKAVQPLLDNDTALTPERRASLKRAVTFDLRYFQELRTARGREPSTPLVRPGARSIDNARRADDQRQRIDGIRSLINARSRTLADARGYRNQSAERFVGVQRKVLDSSVPAKYDYELPADWVEKSQKRSPQNKMTAEERAIMKALATTLEVDFQNNTLSSVIDYLQKRTGRTFVVDRSALQEVGATSDTPVNLRLKATVRTILKKVLGELNLTYVVKNETITVTSFARAREMLTTRAYYVGDLISNVNVFMPPALNRLQMMRNVAVLMDQIQSQTDPASWQKNGGPGTITFDPVTMTLVIKQTAEFHYKMGGGH